MVDKEFTCELCKKRFSSRRSLNQHVRLLHRPSSKVFRCDKCNFQSKYKNALQHHIAHHDKLRRPAKVYSCILCRRFTCELRQGMIEHYGEAHEVPLSQRTQSFASFEDFEKWKIDVEKADVCRFKSIVGKQARKAANVRYYRCSRDGVFISEGKGIRRLKATGSIKMGGICPASMKVVTDTKTGMVDVTFVLTHVGHGEDLGRLNLTKAKKAKRASKIAQNTPSQDISDQSRTSKRNELPRSHLTTSENIIGKHPHHVASGLAADADGTLEPSEENADFYDLILSTDDSVSMEEVIIDGTSKHDAMDVTVSSLDEKKWNIRVTFEEIMENLQTEEHAEILWNSLLSVIPAFKAASSSRHFVPASQVNQVNVLQKMSPQKNVYSLTVKCTMPQNTLSKPTDGETRTYGRTDGAMKKEDPDHL